MILLCDHEPTSYLLALDKRTGEEHWKADRGQGLHSYSTPTVVAGPEHLLWCVPTGAPYVSSVVHYDGVVHLARDAGVLQASDAETGERLFQGRTGGVFTAAPIAGDGKVYFLSETGEMIVVRASREMDILARNTIPARFLASPVASNGQIFLRSDDQLICVGND